MEVKNIIAEIYFKASRESKKLVGNNSENKSNYYITLKQLEKILNIYEYEIKYLKNEKSWCDIVDKKIKEERRLILDWAKRNITNEDGTTFNDGFDSCCRALMRHLMARNKYSDDE